MWLGSQATPGAEVGLILMPITPAERRGHYLGADVALAPSHKGHLQSDVILQNPGVKPITRISSTLSCCMEPLLLAPAAPRQGKACERAVGQQLRHQMRQRGCQRPGQPHPAEAPPHRVCNSEDHWAECLCQSASINRWHGEWQPFCHAAVDAEASRYIIVRMHGSNHNVWV